MAAFKDIRAGYYSQAGAMYLSYDATDRCLALLAALEVHDPRTAKAEATALRTQLKLDIGSYSEKDAKTPLP